MPNVNMPNWLGKLMGSSYVAYLIVGTILMTSVSVLLFLILVIESIVKFIASLIEIIPQLSKHFRKYTAPTVDKFRNFRNRYNG